MIFLSLIAVLAIVHLTAFGAVLQKDAWFVVFINRLRRLPAISSMPLLPMLLALILPLIVLVFCMLVILHYGFSLYLFFIYVPVLLYSLGRGDFVAEINHYIETATRGDIIAANQIVDNWRGRVDMEDHIVAPIDWQSLHTRALKIISYRGFERTFAVMFWFVIAGPVGALLYRLSVIYREQTIPNSSAALLAEKWLWIIEFPAVRLMGLTWAFVGNFDGCPWRDSLFDTDNSSITILNNSLRGALSAPTDAYRSQATIILNGKSAVNDNNVVNESSVIKENDIAQEETIVQEEAIVQEEPTVNEKTEAEQAAEIIAHNEEAQEVIEDLVGITLSPQAEPAYSFALVKSSVPLYSRSLLFCVGVIAFATLFI